MPHKSCDDPFDGLLGPWALGRPLQLRKSPTLSNSGLWRPGSTGSPA